MARVTRQRQDASSSNQGTKNVEGKRNRASPALLLKLSKKLTKPQRDKIDAIGFGGLLKMKCETIPARLANWLMVDCFDADSMQLVLPGRGVIKVTAEAVQYMFNLPNEGDQVEYKLDVNAINFIQSKYRIAQDNAPKIKEVRTRVEKNKRANSDFIRSWLMLAISTFLCPPTSLGISPRCYPSIVDLSAVTKLNWCKFVVDQLKKAGSKMEARQSVKGCVLFLVLLYVDSLLVDGVDIPATTVPRAEAWSRSLIDQVVKLDTNRDDSFGKLKLRSCAHTVVQTSLFQLDDLSRFVSSKVSTNMTNQRKRQLTTAVSDFCDGFTNLMGSFLEKISAIEHPSSHEEQRQSRSRRARQASEEEDEHKGADYEEDDSKEEEYDDNVEEEEDEAKDETDEEDEAEDETDEEDEAESEEASEEPVSVEENPHVQSVHLEEFVPPEESVPVRSPPTPFDGPGNISEDEHSSQEPLIQRLRRIEKDGQAVNQDEDSQKPSCPPFQPPAQSSPATVQAEDLIQEPLIQRLRRIQKGGQAGNQDEDSQKPSCPPFQPPAQSSPARGRDDQIPIEPVPICMILPANLNKPANAQNRKAKLRLPSNPSEQKDAGNVAAPTTSVHNVGEASTFKVSGSQGTCSAAENKETDEAVKMNPLAFTPPSFDLGISPSRFAGGASGSTCSLDEISEETFKKIEDEAFQEIATRKRKAQAEEPSSATNSVTPAYQPPPKRAMKMPAILRSPYVDYTSQQVFKCSKEVLAVYNAVCKHAASPKGSQPASTMIANFWELFIFLEDLAPSVKPRGHLHNTVAEITLQVIDFEKRKARTVKQRVLPLRVSTFIQMGQLEASKVTHVFRRADNHLDHREMVMFPVLEVLEELGSKRSGIATGHYYLLVLNLRAKRFKVMDSMRSLEDKRLAQSCNKIMVGIKALWRKYYPNSKHDIDTSRWTLVCQYNRITMIVDFT